ncbi:hypothetical protein KKA08_09485 [bacterium]|nr:hypothetical protein [bacterium]
MVRELTLYPTPPYDFDLSFHSMGPSNPDPVVSFEEGILWQLIALDSDRELMACVHSVGTCDKPELVLRLEANTISDEDVEISRNQIVRMLCLDLELDHLYEAIMADPVLHRYCLHNRGLKPVIDASPFEAITWAIIGQQVNLKFACQVKRGMLERYGRRIRYKGRTFFRYPEPKDLAFLDPVTWKEFKSSQRKAEYIIDFSRLITEGFDLEGLANLTDEEIIEKLLQIRGIGNWTAEYALIQGFGRWNALPTGDAGLQNCFKRLYELDRKPTYEELVKKAGSWQPYRGLATYYLWWGKSEP